MAYFREGRPLILFIVLLMVFQIYPGIKVTIAEEDAEHTYIIFEDDFKDGEAEDWSLNIVDEAPPGSSWAVELDDGNHVFRAKGQTWADAGDYLWANYTFEVKIKMLSPQGGGIISFRMAGPSRYFIQFWSNGLGLTKEYSGTPSQLKQTEIRINLNIWYDFKVVCVGNSLWVYLDDTLKFDYTDALNPFLSGRIGIEGSPDSHIYFDDVKVTTTDRLYTKHLIQKAQTEIDKAQWVDADISDAEQILAEAQAAFSEGNLSLAESLAVGAIITAKNAPVGSVSSTDLMKYNAEYDQHTVEISGTIRDIRYEQGMYSFAIDDGTGVISATFNGTLGEIKTDDEVKVLGKFNASITTISVQRLEKMQPEEDLFTFLIFKDDFEDGDISGWNTHVDPTIEGSLWKIERENDEYVLSGEGMCGAWAGDSEWTDYIFEVKVKLVKGGACINFRTTHYPEGAETYFLYLSREAQELVKLEPYLNEMRDIHLKRLNIDLEHDNWYTVKIVCLENNFKIYLNDNLKLDYTDESNPFLSGFIGLETVTPAERPDYSSHILYDDVKVSRIATTNDINDLIAYAQSGIDKAREINADVISAELKLEQAKQALANEDYQIVQYMVDEAVWLTKRASLGEISIKDLRAMATLCSGHVVVITGTVESLQAQYGTGYNFNLNDGTGGLTVTYQGVLTDIGDGYTVRVTGIFDAPSEAVAASTIEKISDSSTPISSGPFGITLSIELVTAFITIGGTAVGVIGWFIRHERAENRRKVLFKKLLDEVDSVYSRFKMNAIQCEAELYKLKDEALDEFKQGTIDEGKHNILEQRIAKYMKEVKEQIEE